MKRIFVSLSLMLSVGLTTALANGNPDINRKIKESFQNEFAGAKFVEWNETEGYQVATFVYLSHRVLAVFNQAGELQGSARGILFEELPLAVTRSFDKHFSLMIFLSFMKLRMQMELFTC